MKARGLEPNIAKMSDAEVDAFLREAGIDPEKELARAMELIAEHERKAACTGCKDCQPGICPWGKHRASPSCCMRACPPSMWPNGCGKSAYAEGAVT